VAVLHVDYEPITSALHRSCPLGDVVAVRTGYAVDVRSGMGNASPFVHSGRWRGTLASGSLATTMLLAAILSGCSVSSADQQGIRDAWAARDAQRAAECRRKNVGYAAGGCVAGGP
jgi:hypothetical protein